MKTLYVDELFLLNGVINYILLLVTKKIIRAKASQPRLLIGSIISALYAVFMFLPHTQIFYSFLAKLLFSFMLVAITYNIRKLRQYIRAVAVFYMVSFAFGGAAFAIISMTGWNDMSYLPVKILVTSTVIAYACLTFLSSYYKRAAVKQRSTATVSITVNDETAVVNCFFDTGNSLYDPISDSPVMVVEYNCISSILPPEISYYLKEGTIENLPPNFNRRLRFIPYSSIGKKNGVILGFKPDRVVLDEKVFHNIVIGICENSLAKDNSYDALINPHVLGGAL